MKTLKVLALTALVSAIPAVSQAADPTDVDGVITLVQGGGAGAKTSYLGYAAVSGGIFLAGVAMWAARKGVGIKK